MADDTIYRQAAIKAIENLQDCYNGFSDTYDKACIIGALEEVPSAQPGIVRCQECRNFNKARLLIPQSQRKTGKWVYLNGLDAFECSVCGRQMVRNIFDYCPWCGAEMTKGEEDE